jgi:cytochrome P450
MTSGSTVTATSDSQDGVLRYPFGPPVRLELDEHYARLRSAPGLTRVRLPYGSGWAWLAVRHADVRAVYSDPRFGVSGVTEHTPRVQAVYQQPGSILSLDPPEHSRLRMLVAKAFTARRMQGLRPMVQGIVEHLLDAAVAGGGPVDLVEALAVPLPVAVICELLGVPVHDQPRFRVWSEAITGTGDDHASTERAWQEFYGYLAELATWRRAELARGEQPDDLMTALIVARDEQDRLSERELVLFLMTLLVAGHETTANQLACSVYHLVTTGWWEPTARRLAAASGGAADAVCNRLVEELLRFVPLGSSGAFARVATQDVELGGQRVAAGEVVLPAVFPANRDERVFDDPDRFDPERTENPHITFGFGAHHCLGAQLARTELRVGLAALLRRAPGLRLAVDAADVRWRRDALIRGPRALPVLLAAPPG